MRFIATLLLVLCATMAHATWKPEYGLEPMAVQKWYESTRVPGYQNYYKCLRATNATGLDYDTQQATIKQKCEPLSPAYKRLGIAGCCDNADRFMTKFVGGADDSWSFYTDPQCTHAGCPLALIPSDVVETDPIEPDPQYLKGLTPQELEAVNEKFNNIRREGVLFIYNGKPTCFWPPEGGI